jgi:DNA-binding IclR family transcriptional regulator
VQNDPPYRIGSVDYALRLATLLLELESVGVKEASDLLGVAPSTAHRLLAMLVFREFAEQGDDRRYRAGTLLRGAENRPDAVRRLREASGPHMRTLVARTGETASLQLLVGADVRILESVESGQLLRVSSRTGARLPAHLASGGLVLLAALSSEEVTERCSALLEDERTQLRADMTRVRRNGFAVNDERTEPGVSAVAVPINWPLGSTTAALALAMPTLRFGRKRLATIAQTLSEVARSISDDLTRES